MWTTWHSRPIHRRTPVQELPSVAMPAENPLDSRLRRDQKAPGPTRGRDPTKIAELLADEPSGPSFSRNYRCRKDVRPTGGRGRRRSGQRGLRVGEQQLALLREEEERLGVEGRRITVHFSFVALYFSLVFLLSQLLAVSERRLRLDGTGATHVTSFISCDQYIMAICSVRLANRM